MKKIAVCLSGQSRTWNYCIDSIKSFLEDDEYQIDYFIHTWDINTYRPLETIDGSEKYFYNSELDIDGYIKAYNPKLYKVQSIDSFKNKLDKINVPKIIRGDNINLLNLIYSFKQSIVLKRIWERKNGFKYDYVIKLRPDLFFVYPSLKENIKLLEPIIAKKFFSFFMYENGWENMLDSHWTPDLYWLFTSTEDADEFSTYYGKLIKYRREQNNLDYEMYRFTNDINFTPYYNSDFISKIIKFAYMIRPYQIPFLQNYFKSKLSEYYIDKFHITYYSLEQLIRPCDVPRKDFKKRKMLVDLIKENNSLEDIEKKDIVNIINENENIIKYINYYIEKNI